MVGVWWSWVRGLGFCGGYFLGDVDESWAEEAVVEFIASADLCDDGAFGVFIGGDVLGGFVEVGVEGFSECIDRGDAVIFEELLELGVNHFEAFEDGGVASGFSSLEAEFEVVEDGDEIFEERFCGVADGFFFFTDEAFAGVIPFCEGAEVFFLGLVEDFEGVGGDDGVCRFLLCMGFGVGCVVVLGKEWFLEHS
jgi:hypothetical protein